VKLKSRRTPDAKAARRATRLPSVARSEDRVDAFMVLLSAGVLVGLTLCECAVHQEMMLNLDLLIPVEAVHGAMKEWREEKSGSDDEYEAGVEGKEASEQLPTERLRRIDGAHAAEEHCSVKERVDPR